MTTSNARSRTKLGPSKLLAPGQTTSTSTIARRPITQIKIQSRVAKKGITRTDDDGAVNSPSDPSEATEGFNAALKLLSEALKAKASDGFTGIQSDSTWIESQEQTPTRSPLQSRSPNRPAKKAGSKTAFPDNKQPTSRNTADFVRVGESAIACLSRLYLLKERDGKHDKTILDQGSLTLSTKLLGLGIIELVIKELCNFGQRLDRDHKTPAPESLRNGTSSGSDRLKYLVSCLQKYPSAVGSSKEAVHIMNYQTLILKVLARQGTYSSVLLELLDISDEHSPSGFITYCLNKGLLNTDEALQRRSNLVQLVSALASSVRDTETSPRRRKFKYELSCLSLELRCVYWQTGQEEIDLTRELWKPFTRHLSSLDTLAREKSLDDVTFIFSRFQGIRDRSVPLSRAADTSPPSFVLQALGDFANRIGESDRALAFFREAEAYANNSEELSRTTLSCKTAIASLGQIEYLEYEAVSVAVDAAISALQRPLKGGLRELNVLLTDVVQLRRATAQAIVGLSKRDREGGNLASKNLEHRCSNAIIACVRFFLRYLRATGKSNNAGVDAKLVQILGSMQSAVDSALAVLKNRAVCDTTEEWGDSEQALSDAHQLATHVIDHLQAFDSSSWRGIFSRISNIICCRAQIAPTSAKIELLRKAINIVQKRPPNEWRNGALSAKYEKLASLLYGQGVVGDAISTYSLAVRACLDPETTADLSQLVAEGASEATWIGCTENVHRLDSVINSHIKLGIKGLQKISENCNELVDETVPQDVRVALLERYLQHLLRMSPSKVPQTLAINLSKAVLSLYRPSEYPLRRLRVLLCVLSQSSKQSQKLFFPLLDELANDETHFRISDQDLGHDACLKSQKSVLISCFQMVSAFHLGQPSTDLLEHTVDSWEILLQSLGPNQTLKARIEQEDQFFGLIGTIVNYTDAMGLQKVQSQALRVMHEALRLNDCKDSSAISSVMIQSASLQIRIAKVQEAEKCLVKAKQLLESSLDDNWGYLRMYLVSAELGLETGDYSLCSNSIEEARKRAVAITESNVAYSKIDLDRLLSNAALLKSRVCREIGQINQAEFYAKQSAKLSIRLWSVLESSDTESEAAENTVDMLTEKFAAIKTAPRTSSRGKDSGGAIFWPHLSDHLRSLLHISSVTAYNGAYQDAVYYAEQAERLAKTVGSSNWLVHVRSVLANHYLGGGFIDQAIELLDMCRSQGSQVDSSLTMFYVEKALARANCVEGYWKTALEHADLASKILRSLSTPASRTPSLLSSAIEPSSTTAKPVKFPDKDTKAKRTVARGQGRKTPAKKEPRPQSPPSKTQQLVTASRFDKLSAELILHIAEIHATGLHHEEALGMLDELVITRTGFDGIVKKASLLFQVAKNTLQNDTVYGVLIDSAISLPSRGKLSSTVRPNLRGKKNASSSPADILEQILGMLEYETVSLQGSASVGCIHLFTELEAQTKLLMSAIRPSADISTALLLQSAHLAKNAALGREASAVKTEICVQNPRYLSRWPGNDSETAAEFIEDLSSSALCQSDTGVLPSSWKVISISISQDKKELLLGKMQRDQEAFTLRLPIQRQPEEEDDDEIEPFDYEACRSEFLEIIEEANASAHATGSRNDKQGKKDWWTRRENLDQKLGALLENIENIWLGGYRGIFCADTPHEAWLADFARSLERVLDSHLPSRQKPSAGTRTKIHKNVLDLFIGLGDPDLTDLIDPVADLLAFVVDILQFSGEANAYDEIDFDMMTIETIDAIRAYHKRVIHHQPNSNHIILILDKDLLCLPWESLPCLRGKSVSRLPSLRCLQLRLDQMRSSSLTRSASVDDGISIPSTSGSYILNPSSDLTSTDTLFSPILSSSLPTFSSITSRAPTEDEFLNSLTSSSLLLYFGHGSGAQYIRGRTIRKIQYAQEQEEAEFRRHHHREQQKQQTDPPSSLSPSPTRPQRQPPRHRAAAVTFLMGCSSAAMHEAGPRSRAFSPYGVPWNYMHAGAPAVVGTLWDVTDKDIDRFALHALVRWGLLEPEHLHRLDESAAATRSRSKAKAKRPKRAGDGEASVRGGRDVRGTVGLCRAVAEAREEACVLRFLNAAAVVVYGVPVYLQD